MIYRLATAKDVDRLAELFWEHVDEFEPLNPADKRNFVSECARKTHENNNLNRD